MFGEIFKWIGLWKSQEPEVATSNSPMHYINDVFKYAVSEYTWYLYGISTVMFCLCTFYYIRDYKRKEEVRRQHEEMQRLIGRNVQPRRPGAIHRSHEIFRNAVRTVHQYIQPEGTAIDTDKQDLTRRPSHIADDERPLMEENN